MSNQVLQMKYHPAKKEVMFKRFQSGNEVAIRKDSRLTKYMNKKGDFILQYYGNDFFDDIAYTFSGEEEIVIEVITTKGDFEDLMTMLEYYNEDSKMKITAKLIAELPDMEETYEAVKKHGCDSMRILDKHRLGFREVLSEADEVRKYIEKFSNEIFGAKEEIKNKINSLEQNTVNICFSGAYSAGKSMLINSILGYSVLPENIKPETAAMFRIKSPEKGSPIRVAFDIRRDHSEIIWNEKMSVFEFIAGPTESDCRKKIQDVMNENKDKPRHYQLERILNTLNKEQDVNRNIDVYFPIPLDSERAQFTIFDTPGTDSGEDEHQKVLQEALSEQTNSILIFVISPDHLKGEGNRTLLRYLGKVEKEEKKVTIDLGRSFFVINKADTLIKDVQFTELKQSDIQVDTENDNEEINIRLADKKLFFTSAAHGYVAQAVKNDIATDDDEYLYKKDDVIDRKHGCYYRYDQCAASEYATNSLISKCEQEFDSAAEKKDRCAMVWIGSGLYALQKEIVVYGEKYSSAVKAYSIIDCVDKVLAKLDKEASALKQESEDNIKRVEEEIETVKTAVMESIDKEYEKRKLPEDGEIPDGILSKLELDQDSLNRLIHDNAESKLRKIIKGFFIFKKRRKEEDKDKVDETISNILDDYTRRFNDNRKKVLESIRDEFIDEIKKAINENGGLSEEAKSYITDIEPPEIVEFNPENNIAIIYEKCCRSCGFWIFKYEGVDETQFISEAGKELYEMGKTISREYKKEYKNELASLLGKVKEEFTRNMEKYNALLLAKRKDKEAMERLKQKIEDAAEELRNCQKKLDDVIWKEI